MPDNAMQMIEYHSARAVEELELAEIAHSDPGRRAHMELCHLHLSRAARLKALSLAEPSSGSDLAPGFNHDTVRAMASC